MVEDFGPYRVVRKIAVGGMAEIYLARQHGLEGVERTVILKRILPAYAKNPEFVTMFLDEARLMAALSHPAIAQVFDLGKDDNSYYLVMEYVRGPTLGSMLNHATRSADGGLPEREALAIGLSIAQALDYVHGLHDDLGRPLNIVHRDLNPANVLVAYTGAVKIIDFGIAKAATKVYETRTGVIKGTYGYIAPEQLTRAAPVDHRADVFALGVLMYEMCVGKHPFDTSDEPNLIDRILDAKYKRPRQVVPSFPRALDRLISRCLAPHPEGRPESMRQVIEEMVAHMAQRSIVPTMPDIGALAHALVPDKEGARPLKPLRSSQIQVHPPFRTDHSHTAPLPKAPQPETDIGVPNLAELLEGESDETVRVSAPRHHAHVDEDELQPTRVASLRGAAMVPDHGEPPTALAVHMPDPRRAHVAVGEMALDRDRRRRQRRRARTMRRGLLLAGSIVLVIGVGIAAFVTARAIGGGGQRAALDTANAPDPDAGELLAAAGSDAPEARAAEPSMLTVVSEPDGAAIFLGGEDQQLTTPATIVLSSGEERVWVRLELDGYVTEEREVRATIGETRFDLQQLIPDAGPPDAGPPPAKTKRVWRPRRRGTGRNMR